MQSTELKILDGMPRRPRKALLTMRNLLVDALSGPQGTYELRQPRSVIEIVVAQNKVELSRAHEIYGPDAYDTISRLFRIACSIKRDETAGHRVVSSRISPIPGEHERPLAVIAPLPVVTGFSASLTDYEDLGELTQRLKADTYSGRSKLALPLGVVIQELAVASGNMFNGTEAHQRTFIPATIPISS